VFGAAEAVHHAINVSVVYFLRADYERDVAAVRAHLDAATFVAWAARRKMTLEQAITEALNATSPPVEPRQPEPKQRDRSWYPLATEPTAGYPATPCCDTIQ
jgi:hypothetical protein